MATYDRNASAWTSGATRVGAAEYDQGLRAHMLGIYNYMTLALGISALVAWGSFAFGLTRAIMTTPLAFIVMLAPLGFVFFMSFRFERMSYQSLMGTFLAFSATMGLSLSTIFVAYKVGSVVQVFFMTAAAFGALSLYGYTTRRSLSAMGSFLVMGLFGLIIASLVNIFLQSSAMQFGLNVLGILIFAGLTAWDTQRLKDEYDYVAGNPELAGKASVMGALSLYLNFINMFQLLLQLFGQRNSSE